MSDIQDQATAEGNKAWAWLKVHWYAFAIGAAAGVLVGHIFWR